MRGGGRGRRKQRRAAGVALQMRLSSHAQPCRMHSPQHLTQTAVSLSTRSAMGTSSRMRPKGLRRKSPSSADTMTVRPALACASQKSTMSGKNWPCRGTEGQAGRGGEGKRQENRRGRQGRRRTRAVREG